MTMADDDLSPEDQAAADTLMQELLDAGFSYERNGRVAGFAGIDDDPEGGGDGAGAGDGGVGAAGDDDAGGDGTGAAADEGAGAGGDGAGGDPTGGGSEQGQQLERGAHTGRLELRGTPLTETEADGLLHLRKLLIDHPDLAAQINSMAEAKLAGRPVPPLPAPAAAAPVDDAPAPPPLPDFIDPDNPVEIGLWKEIVDIRKGQEETQATVSDAVEQAGTAKVQADIGAAIGRFRAAHPDLDDTDIATIRDYTAVNVNIPGIMANFPGDPVEGLVRALEMGSMTDPATRDKVLGVRDDRSKQDADRQRALSALSGGGGAGSRRAPKQPKPTTWQDVSARLATELASMRGNN